MYYPSTPTLLLCWVPVDLDYLFLSSSQHFSNPGSHPSDLRALLKPCLVSFPFQFGMSRASVNRSVVVCSERCLAEDASMNCIYFSLSLECLLYSFSSFSSWAFSVLFTLLLWMFIFRTFWLFLSLWLRCCLLTWNASWVTWVSIFSRN